MAADIRDLHYLIADAQRIGIFFHTYPDWDCLGCAFAIRQLIFDNYANKIVKVYGDRKGKLFFLGLEGITTKKDISPDFKKKNSLAIVVDTWKKEKIECSEFLNKFEKVVIIDHHNPYDTSGILESNLYIRDTNAISCAEVVLKVAEEFNWHISPLTASFLYCGLWGDSQGFMNYNINKEVFMSAHKLMKLGADVKKINQHVEKRDLIHAKFKSQLILNGKQKKKIFYSIVEREPLDTFKKRFNTELRLFFIVHSINIRGANIVGIYFKYLKKLVIAIHTKYDEKKIKEIGFSPLRNNNSAFSYQKNFEGDQNTLEEELEKVNELLF